MKNNDKMPAETTEILRGLAIAYERLLVYTKQKKQSFGGLAQ